MKDVVRTITLGPFPKGMDNIALEHALPEGTFRNGVNVALSNSGHLARREGRTLAVGGAQCHSFFSRVDGDGDAYYVDYKTLYRLPATGALTKQALRTDLTPGLPMSYDVTPLGVVYSNTQVIGLINADGTLSDLSMAMPNSVPSLSVSAGGNIPAGYYQLTYTWVDINGRESAALYPVRAQVTDNSILTLGGLPGAAAPAAAVSLRLYMSPTNGENLYAIGDYAAATSAITLSGLPTTTGKRCRTLGLLPLPAGSIVRYFFGRVYVVSGNLVYFSEPYNLGLYDPLKDIIPFDVPVTMWEPATNGIYVSTDQTYHIRAGRPISPEGIQPNEFHLRPVLPYKAIAGTSRGLEKSTEVLWFSERGVIIGNDNGEVKNLTEEHVAFGPASSGGALYRSFNGIRQIIGSLAGFKEDALVSKTWMTAEVTREGISL